MSEPQAAAERLGQAVRSARRELGMTQSDLGEYVGGIDRHMVAGIERGQVTQQVRRLLALLDVLGLDITVRPRSERLAAMQVDGHESA